MLTYIDMSSTQLTSTYALHATAFTHTHHAVQNVLDSSRLADRSIPASHALSVSLVVNLAQYLKSHTLHSLGPVVHRILMLLHSIAHLVQWIGRVISYDVHILDTLVQSLYCKQACLRGACGLYGGSKTQHPP